jgi:hypothetical protein
VRARIAPYRREIKKMLPAELKLAGLVYAINGKIRVADLFGNPLLMAKLTDKLLSAYILEALGQKVVRGAPAISAGKAQVFLNRARKAKAKSVKSYGRSRTYRKQAKGVVGAETVDQATGKKVREVYFAQ